MALYTVVYNASGYFLPYQLHSWARNLKNVAPQKQNAICKPSAQYAKRNCTFELLKAHCAATINANNASFHVQNSEAQKTQ
jgi:hypothetical protein